MLKRKKKVKNRITRKKKKIIKKVTDQNINVEARNADECDQNLNVNKTSLVQKRGRRDLGLS